MEPQILYAPDPNNLREKYAAALETINARDMTIKELEIELSNERTRRMQAEQSLRTLSSTHQIAT